MKLWRKRYSKLPRVKAKRKESWKKYEQKHGKGWRKEKIKLYKQRPEVKKRRNEYEKNRNLKNANYNLTNRLRNQVRSALRIYSKTGKIMKSRDYGIDYKAIIEYLKPFPEDRENYHIDHIIPLCTFNLNDAEEISKAFAPGNHQWLTIEENLAKGKKYVSDVIPR